MSDKPQWCFGIAAFVLCLALLPSSQSASRLPQVTAESKAAPWEVAPTAPSGMSGVDILSDTNGFDFGPYLRSTLDTIKETWYGVIPATARAPKMRRGEVFIQLAIAKTGKVKGMKVVKSSDDVSLNHAAWLGISDSRLSPLPVEFTGQYLWLRLHFSYNPDQPSDLVLQYRE